MYTEGMKDLGPQEILIIIILLAIFVFEVAMFVSALRNPRLSTSAKLAWAIGMVLLHPIVAIVYYFVEFRKPRAAK